MSDALKRQAAEAAVDAVVSGMVLGLGHGSTAIFALRRIARRLAGGELRDVRGVPCSRAVERDALELGIPLTTFASHPVLDLTIDGADEIGPGLHLIKGGGGALLREKIVAQASRRVVIVADETKCSPTLGTRAPVPVEVLPFACAALLPWLEELGARPVLRTAGSAPFTTDQGNWIVDCRVDPLSDPAALAARLADRAGILGHGLFLDLADEVVVAGATGVRRLTRPRGASPEEGG